LSEQPLSPSQPLTCAVCGSLLEPDDRFCRFCGATVGPTPPRADPDQATLQQAPVVDADMPPESLAADEQPAAWPATDDELWGYPSRGSDAPESSKVEEIAVETDEVIVEPAPPFGPDPEPIYVDAELSTPPPPEPQPGPALPFSPDPFTTPPPPPPEPKGSNRTWWIIGGIVLAFILICCCLGFGIAIVANADSAFQDELRGTAGLWLAGW
jgi:hypothetical protein